MTKSDLRVTAKAARAAAFGALTPYARLACAIALAELVDARLDDAKIVAAYLPIGSEIDAQPSIDRCTARGLRRWATQAR